MRETADRGRLHLALLGAFLLLYLVVSLRHLTVVPPIYEDEPWQASTGLKLARQGVFGTDLFAGLYGMEHRYYGYMPVHPLFLAATYRLAGFGLFQTRLEPVVMGLLALLLTYALGKRLFDSTVGLAGVALLLLVRTTGLTRIQPTGILLLDMARIARYDMVVPIFGLSSLHVFLSADRRNDWRLYAAAGLLSGLAGLSHLYGAFWIVVLGILALWNGAGWRSLLALATGFAAPWILYLAYVLGDLPDWAAQTRGYGPRFGLLSPSWYWSNLVHEWHRYGPGLRPFGMGSLLRPGFWTALVVVPASLVALARRAAGDGAPARAARAVVVPALVFPALFALLITLKLSNYLVTVFPIVALAAAWGGVTLWRRAGPANPPRRWIRPALVALLLALAVEGASRIVALERTAVRTTPYADFIARVHAHIPPRSRVVGLHNYWLGLDDLDYRSFVVPLTLAYPASTSSASPSLGEALDAIAPDTVLVDSRIRAFFDQPAARAWGQTALQGWLAARGFRLAATVADPTYGTIEIFRVER